MKYNATHSQQEHRSETNPTAIPCSRLATSSAIEHLITSAAIKDHEDATTSPQQWRDHFVHKAVKHHFHTSLKNPGLFTLHKVFPSHVMLIPHFSGIFYCSCPVLHFLVILSIAFSTRVPNTVVSQKQAKQQSLHAQVCKAVVRTC